MTQYYRHLKRKKNKPGEKRKDQASRIISMSLKAQKEDSNPTTDKQLQAQLSPRGQAEITAMNDLDVVIGKTNRSEGKRREHDQPDKGVREIGPEKRRDQNGDADQHAAHGWGSTFLLVRLRSLFADVLADLKFAQPLNDVRTNQQPDQQCRQAGEDGAKRQITEDAKQAKVRKELLVQQPIEQNVRLRVRSAGEARMTCCD